MATPPLIDLRVSDVEPPDPEPPRTIYRDMLNLPDPVLLGLTVRYYNHDDVQLWFRITGEATGYTFTPVDLGDLGSGANAYRNLDEFASRAKPGSEITESIKLILRAYTDAGYTALKWTYQRTVQVIWIDSSDPSWTVDELDNFDDGTVMGWAAVLEVGWGAGVGVVGDFVLSPPWALRGIAWAERTAGVGWYETRGYIHKNFTTPDRPTVYAIFDVRFSVTWIESGGNVGLKYVEIARDGTVLVYLGRPYAGSATDYLPRDKWMRVVVPLPRNTAVNLRVRLSTAWEITSSGPGTPYQTNETRMDDFKIISK